MSLFYFAKNIIPYLQFYTYAYLESQAQVSYLFQYGLIFFI